MKFHVHPPRIRFISTKKTPLESPSFHVLASRLSGGNRSLGFSLVEVVMALGICSFALIATMSLLPVALDSAKTATETTQETRIYQRISSRLLQKPFADLNKSDDPVYQPMYFDYDGFETDSPARRYYTVELVRKNVQLPGATGAETNLLSLKISSKKRSGSSSFPITVPDTGY